MSNIICEECRWKYNADETDHCPMCGAEPPEEPDMVRQWNSTLKANPNKTPKRSRIKYKPRGPELKDAMIERAKKEIAEAEAEGRRVRCGNCRRPIREIKYENISHRKSRSQAPGERTDIENMDFLCGPTQFWGKIDTSCHTLWERNRYGEFKNKEDSYG